MSERLNITAAVIFTVWGGALVVSASTGDSPRAAFVFGLILVAVGVRFFARRNSTR